MSAERCDCCDLPTAWCGRAAEKRITAEDTRRRAALHSQPGVIEARFTTRCGRCGDRIGPGDLIKPKPILEHLDGEWIHAEECR